MEVYESYSKKLFMSKKIHQQSIINAFKGIDYIYEEMLKENFDKEVRILP